MELSPRDAVGAARSGRPAASAGGRGRAATARTRHPLRAAGRGRGSIVAAPTRDGAADQHRPQRSRR